MKVYIIMGRMTRTWRGNKREHLSIDSIYLSEDKATKICKELNEDIGYAFGKDSLEYFITVERVTK